MSLDTRPWRLPDGGMRGVGPVLCGIQRVLLRVDIGKRMQHTYGARYRAANLEEVRRKDREAKKLKRPRLKLLGQMQIWPMGEFEDSNLSHLYFMRYEFDPCQTLGMKIGRSQNVSLRKAQQEAGHAFRMKVLCAY
jgi:hypothetical protein